VVVADMPSRFSKGRAAHSTGVMIESNLSPAPGRDPGKPLTYGQSIPTAAIDWETNGYPR